MVIRHSKMSKETLDVDDTPIDANISVSSKRKYRNIQSFQHENNKDGMMSIWTDDNCDSVNDDAEVCDPQYEIFLGNLKEDGNSYVLEVSEKNGLLKPLKYEAEDESDDELDQDTQSQMNNTIGGNVEDDRSNSSRGSELEDPKSFISLHENQRKESAVENVARSDPMNPNPFVESQFLVEKHAIEGTHASGCQCKIGMQDGYGEKHESESSRNKRRKSDAAVNIEKKKNDNFGDEYLIYCNNLICNGNNLVFKYQDAPPIVYEGDSRVHNTYSMKGDPKLVLPVHAGRSDAIVEEDDSCQYLGSPTRERHSLFREQVMRILRKPFDKKEHQMLSERILARKPIERNIDLRSGRDQLYTVNKQGKSYLDHYYDLKRKLLAAKTSRQELILLRGFFFWLQNLTQEGAFKPWLDASCLAL